MLNSPEEQPRDEVGLQIWTGKIIGFLFVHSSNLTWCYWSLFVIWHESNCKRKCNMCVSECETIESSVRTKHRSLLDTRTSRKKRLSRMLNNQLASVCQSCLLKCIIFASKCLCSQHSAFSNYAALLKSTLTYKPSSRFLQRASVAWFCFF